MAAGARSSTNTPSSARADPDPRLGRPAAGRPVDEVDDRRRQRADGEGGDGSRTARPPARTARRSAAQAISHRPKWRNGRLRCGDDVEITAVATTSAPGGNTGGPLTSRSRAKTPRSSSMTRRRSRRWSTGRCTNDPKMSRARACRPRSKAMPRSTTSRPTAPRRRSATAVRSGRAASRRARMTSASKSAGNFGEPDADRHRPAALTIAMAMSVGRRARGSAWADAYSWKPAAEHTPRLSGGRRVRHERIIRLSALAGTGTIRAARADSTGRRLPWLTDARERLLRPIVRSSGHGRKPERQSCRAPRRRLRRWSSSPAGRSAWARPARRRIRPTARVRCTTSS